MAKKENERISFEKIENGYLVTHNWDENVGKRFNYINKRFYAKTAIDTKNKMLELQKSITVK